MCAQAVKRMSALNPQPHCYGIAPLGNHRVSKPKTHAVTKIIPSNWAPTKQHYVSDVALTKKPLSQYFSDKANSDEAPTRSSTPASQSSLKKQPFARHGANLNHFPQHQVVLIDWGPAPRQDASPEENWLVYVHLLLVSSIERACTQTLRHWRWILFSFEWPGLALRNSCWSVRHTFQRNN